MTDTLTTPDVNVDIGVDLDAEVACEVKNALTNGHTIYKQWPCDNPARWAGRYPCCAKLAIACDPHMMNRATLFLCMDCHQKFKAYELVGTRRL